MWDRDTLGAINIGAMFLASALGRDLSKSLWARDTTDDEEKAAQNGKPKLIRNPKGWADIFPDIDKVYRLPTTECRGQ